MPAMKDKKYYKRAIKDFKNREQYYQDKYNEFVDKCHQNNKAVVDNDYYDSIKFPFMVAFQKYKMQFYLEYTEAFLAVSSILYKNLQRVKYVPSPTGYIYKAILNILFNLLHNESKKQGFIISLELFNNDTEYGGLPTQYIVQLNINDPITHIEDKVLFEEMDTILLQTLSTDEYRLFYLRFALQMNFKDIMKALGYNNITTVVNRYKDLIMKMHNIFAGIQGGVYIEEFVRFTRYI